MIIHAKGAHTPALLAALVLGGLYAPRAAAQSDEDWQWMVVPYGWAASLDTDVETATPPPGGADVDTNFDDIVDKLDGAFQIHVEGKNARWGFFTDFTFVGLADEKDHPRFDSEADLDARVFELAGIWSPGGDRDRGLDVFAGLRYIDVDMTMRLDPVNPAFESTTIDGGDSFSDFMLGARYTWTLSERWGMAVRGDGSWGGTEGTWNASALGYYRTQHGAWLFGYRYMSVEIEVGGVTTEMNMAGPEVGYAFIF